MAGDKHSMYFLCVSGFLGALLCFNLLAQTVTVDPTAPIFSGSPLIQSASSETANEERFILTTVLYSPHHGQSKAIINGNILGIEEKIGEYIVKNITRQTVTLHRPSPDKTIVLTLDPLIIKTPHQGKSP